MGRTVLTHTPTIGLYELPGGNLEFGEDIFASIKREVLEETGLKIVPKKIIAYTNDIQKAEEKHEVTLYVLSEREDPSQQPEVCTSNQNTSFQLTAAILTIRSTQTKEAHKTEGWEWKAWKEIAGLGEAELYLPTLNLVRSEPQLDSKF